MKLYWKYERLLKGYGGSSGSEARRCEHPQDKEAPGKKGFQIFLPRGMLKGRSTRSSSQTHSGDVHRFVQSPSTSRTSRLSRENRPCSLRHLPMTPQAVREKSKELKIERCRCYGNTFCFINLFALIALVFDSSVLTSWAFLHCLSYNTTEASQTPNTNEKGKKRIELTFNKLTTLKKRCLSF